MRETVNCCCQFGASVSDEWPEFECHGCPTHGGGKGLSLPTEMCKRHKREHAES